MAEQSFAAQMLPILETAILKLAKGTNQSVDFNGQTYNKKDASKLLEIREKMRQEVQSETASATLAAGGIIQNRRVVTRFVDSSYGPGSPFPRTRPL